MKNKKIKNFFQNVVKIMTKIIKEQKKCNNSRCPNSISIYKIFNFKKNKHCIVCNLQPMTEKFSKRNLIDQDFFLKNIDLSDVHFVDTSFLILQNSYIFVYLIEVLEFWQEKINFNRELDFRETEKIKFYQKFLFFIRDKTMSNFIVNIHFGQKTNKAKKKQVVLIELLLQTCDLLNFFKNKNLLFFTIENENKIAEILKKIKKEEPCRLKITR